ncbi:MAG: DUF2514 family protein [Planctomycetota bacterium]
MSVLALLSPTAWWVVGGTAAVVVAGFGIEEYRIRDAQGDLASERAARATEREKAADVALRQTAEFRAKEQAWAKNHEEIINNAIHKTEAAAAAVTAANDASERLRVRIASLATQARRAAYDSTVARPGKAAPDPIGMFADVLGKLDERAGFLAAAADRARIAGLACEASYETLRH